MTPPRPLITIVLPTFNSAPVVAGALESLAGQTFRDFEVVVSDGGSTDGTLAVVDRFVGRLPALLVESRPDHGVYDAINRAIVRMRGQWFLVLGSDDCLHSPETLALVAPHLSKALEQGDRGPELVYGDVRIMVDGQGRSNPRRYAGEMSLRQLVGDNLCQQSVFYRRTLFDALGGFDLRYPLYADWHFNLAAALRRPIQWIDLIVADYAATGISAGRQDLRFLADRPLMLRRALLERPHDPRLWPLHRWLLKDANRLRRKGRWREAMNNVGAFLRLRLQRRRPVD